MTERISVTIPDEAWDAVVEACPIGDVNAAKGSAWDINNLQQKAVEAAAPLIVAAELERLAAEFGTFNRTRLRSMGLDKESVDIPAQNMELARVRDLLSSRAAGLRGVSGISADGGEGEQS